MKKKALILLLSIYTISLSSQNHQMFEITIEEVKPDRNKNYFNIYPNGVIASASLKNMIDYCAFHIGEVYEYAGKDSIHLNITCRKKLFESDSQVDTKDICQNILQEIIKRYSLIIDQNNLTISAVDIDFKRSQIEELEYTKEINYWVETSGDVEGFLFLVRFSFLVHFLRPDETYQKNRLIKLSLTFEEIDYCRGDLEKVLEVLKKHDIHGEIVEVPYIRLL